MHYFMLRLERVKQVFRRFVVNTNKNNYQFVPSDYGFIYHIIFQYA